jgi:di/tricarboxylate transporter
VDISWYCFAVVFVAAVFAVPIVISALAGVLAMVLTRCLATDEVYGSINWEIIFLLAGVIPLGIAMQKSGAAAFLANGIVNIAEGSHPIIILALFYLVTTLLTEIISNNASVALLVPIALSVAEELSGIPPSCFGAFGYVCGFYQFLNTSRISDQHHGLWQRRLQIFGFSEGGRTAQSYFTGGDHIFDLVLVGGRLMSIFL